MGPWALGIVCDCPLVSNVGTTTTSGQQEAKEVGRLSSRGFLTIFTGYSSTLSLSSQSFSLAPQSPAYSRRPGEGMRTARGHWQQGIG